MRHYFSTRVRVILVVAVLLAVGLSLASSVIGFDLPEKLVQSVMTPLRSGVTAMQRQVEQFYSYMFRYEALLAENAALKEQLAQMQDDAREAAALARENQRLQQLLGLQQQHEHFKYMDANVISWNPNNWASGFTIDRGTNVGITAGQCVITANGEVVGLVTEVGINYAVVKSVLDSSLEISATVASAGYSGMVKGGYATGHVDMLRMDYLPSDSIIRNEDQVTTAGSTVYPRGLILGYVVDAGFDDIGVAKFAILRPAADFDSLEQVFVLTDYNNG
jgi:rod shape-determining protein MreC